MLLTMFAIVLRPEIVLFEIEYTHKFQHQLVCHEMNCKICAVLEEIVIISKLCVW